MSISLDDMAALARALLDADQEVDNAEQELKDAKERARVLREETIPSAMQELGLEELKLNTGQKLSIKQEVYASIPAANKGQAYDWLNDHGFGGLIKVEVTTQFGKGEQEEAVRLSEQLRAMVQSFVLCAGARHPRQPLAGLAFFANSDRQAALFFLAK